MELGLEATQNVAFRIDVAGDQIPLRPMLRDDLFRIVREALINAFRHARAKKIEIELNYNPKRLCIRVRDDGCGIDPAIVRAGREGHWGLSGMQERAKQIGAQFSVMSSPSGGTEIETDDPGVIAYHAAPSRRIPWFGRKRPLP